MEFDDCVGGSSLFYGVDNYMFKVDDHVFEAVEDPDDGYRSCLGSIEVVDKDKALFFREPLAIVKVAETFDGDSTGYTLTDEEDGHVWLRFGTDNSDSYYPCFYFNYTPKLPSQSKPKPSARRYNDIDPFDRLFNSRDS